MNVPLPDPMKASVENQERQHRIVQFQKLISDGLESGLSQRTMEDLLLEARARMDSLG